jgi:hypothetical protein
MSAWLTKQVTCCRPHASSPVMPPLVGSELQKRTRERSTDATHQRQRTRSSGVHQVIHQVDRVPARDARPRDDHRLQSDVAVTDEEVRVLRTRTGGSLNASAPTNAQDPSSAPPGRVPHNRLANSSTTTPKSRGLPRIRFRFVNPRAIHPLWSDTSLSDTQRATMSATPGAATIKTRTHAR